MALNFSSIAMCLALALAALWLVSYPERSYACYCMPTGLPSEGLAESATVFAGRVVSIDRRQVKNSSADPLIVEFDVKTVWKGPANRTIFLKTPVSGVSCGYSFDEGVEYLVYSWNGREVYWCSRTRPLSEAAYDLAELGPGRVLAQNTATPTPVITEQPAGGGCGPSPHADGLLLLAPLVGIVWLGLRKRNPGAR